MDAPPALPSRQDIAAARDDLGAFGRLIGWPLETWQHDALKLQTRQTILISPRQCGKSRSLATLAVWWAFRKPKQLVLVLSAGEVAAARLLRTVRDVAAHPWLGSDVDDETQHRVILSNGSEIRSVPASDSQLRGWSVDLLLIDEAAWVPEDLLYAAALPTTAARPEARIVLASTPWADSGPFWKFATDGEKPGNPHTRTFRWKLADAWWIVPAVIEVARATLPPLRFRCEYEGEFVGASDAYFSHEDILAAVASFPMRHDGDGMPATCGLDWGRRQDAHAVVLAGLLDDYGANGRPIVVVPWAETSRRPYSQQQREIETLAGLWDVTVFSETNAVGQSPTEWLLEHLTRTKIVPIPTNTTTKEDNYGRIATLLAERALVLPDHAELLRQLQGVSAQSTPMGRLRITARTESIHDDLPDAMSLAVGHLPRRLAEVRARPFPDEMPWVETTGGIRVPVPVRLTRPDVSWLNANADLVVCRGCRTAYLPSHRSCPHCQTEGTHEVTSGTAMRKVIQQAPSAWGVIVCPSGHPYFADRNDSCPKCGPGGPRGGGGRIPMLPAGFGLR